MRGKESRTSSRVLFFGGGQKYVAQRCGESDASASVPALYTAGAANVCCWLLFRIKVRSCIIAF